MMAGSSCGCLGRPLKVFWFPQDNGTVAGGFRFPEQVQEAIQIAVCLLQESLPGLPNCFHIGSRSIDLLPH